MLADGRRVIAIIPARSGSKGLPDKNIKLLSGKPLMVYTIEAAIDSGLFDIVHVSTDSNRYADIARQYGGDVPFLRSQELSGDSASTWDAVKEVVQRYRAMGMEFDVCAVLQPTSPLRQSWHIRAAFQQYEDRNAISLTSVVEVEHPVQWCFALDGSLSMGGFAESKYRNARRQDLTKHFRENGAIYITQVECILQDGFDFYSNDCIAYIMGRADSIDIDDEIDFRLAEDLMSAQRRSSQ